MCNFSEYTLGSLFTVKAFFSFKMTKLFDECNFSFTLHLSANKVHLFKLTYVCAPCSWTFMEKKKLCLLDSELFSVACNKSLLYFLLVSSWTSQEIATVPSLASKRDREKNLGQPLLVWWFLQAFAHIFCTCMFNFLGRTWKKIYLYSL